MLDQLAAESQPDMAKHAVFAKLTAQLIAAGVPYEGVSEEGIDYPDDATAQQRATGDAIFAALNWEAERTVAEDEIQQQGLDLADFKDKYQTRIAQIQTDLDALAAASTNQVKQIIGRMLVAERQELKALKAILKG